MTSLGILIPSSSPRLQFILDYVLASRLNVEYYTFTDFEKAKKFKGPLISYGVNNETILNFCSTNLLFEADIKNEKPDNKGIGEDCILFPMDDHPIGFDVFASCFWMLSRYEEYIIPEGEKDKYGRISSEQCIASELDFLDIQIVEIWIDKLKRCLLALFPEIELELERTAMFIPTFDVDHCFAFKSHGFYGSIRMILAGLIKKGPREMLNRISVIFGRKHDPYDTYEMIVEMHENRHSPVFFWLLGDYGGLDKALSLYSHNVQERIDYVNENAILGIHPSVRSSSDESLLREEMESLERMTSLPIHFSRQHYLKFKLPTTFYSLWHLGIEKDFSMAFHDKPGFRLGTAHAVPFFDLEENMEINLNLYSSSLMDATLKHYMKLDPEDAIKEIEKIIGSVNKHGGFLIPIWHNSSLSEYGEWKGWKKVYEYMLKRTAELWD